MRTTKIRKALAAAAIGMAVAAGGCQPTGTDVMTLKNTGEVEPAPQMMTAPANGTYILYGGVEGKELYRKELRKGDELGFRVRGNRVEALAGGTIAVLDYKEFTQGATFTWKMEERKE